jgi:hypothetical protein
MRNAIEPPVTLVIGIDDEPGSGLGIGSGHHIVTGS